MIESFVACSANGFRSPPGVFPPDIPIMDFIKPEYRRVGYAWVVDGVEYSRAADSIDTCSMLVTPNKKFLIVLQNTEKYGADNLLVLNPDGTEARRLINPWPASPEFQLGDKYWFLDVDNWGHRVLAKIAVTRDLPNRSQKAEPTWGTFCDCDTWQFLPLAFIDSKNL